MQSFFLLFNSHKLGSFIIILDLDDQNLSSVLVFIIVSKTVVEILNKMGNDSYSLICNIETGYAKVAQQKSAQSF